MYLTVINRLYFFAAIFPLATLAKGAVVINEIHHDPDVKTELAEFIELYNDGVEPVDLSGWMIADAIAFTFPEGSKLDGGSFAVVAHNPRQFKAKFGISPLGPWLGKLDNDGERIELRDATGQLVDRVRFRLGFPWPIVGDPPGYSIELIHPDLDNNDGHNWRPSVRGDISTKAKTLVAKGGVWKYFKGTKEASNPRTAWRGLDFTESGWLSGRTPIGYGENFMKTTLSDMRNGYTSVYFRKKFTVKDAQKIGALKLALQFDDGFNMWINGRHVAGNNMSTKEPRFSTNATSSAIEQHNFVEFDLPSPNGYLVEGENILAIQAHNASKGGSSDFFIDAELKATVGPTDRGPTPGARNSVFATEPLPRLAKVEHVPKQPKGDEAVVITTVPAIKGDDSEIYAEYQIVRPGSYVHIDGSAYERNWIKLPMNDLGQAGDEQASDGIFSATVPKSVQQHRHLVRYRVSVKNALGQVATAPYPGDPSPNFAYFCYDGIPSWSGKTKPGAKIVEYDSQTLTRVPVYHLISKKTDIENSTWNEKYGGDNYKWKGTLVYDGKVYDHIRYRARGGVWRYAMGKNMWKFDFNRGHSFQARDQYGRDYDTRWDKLNFSACIQQGNFQHRGEQGMFEAVGFKLFELAGVEAPKTHWVHFRIIDEAAETGTTQYDGDFWGLYLVLEQMDGRFLDEHSLPDGNLYKMEGGSGELNNQGPTAATDKSDLNSYLSRYQGNPSESWWRQNMDLPRYYSYRTIVEGIHHYDIGYGKNYFYYLNPETQKWSTLPWDLDLTWASNMYGNGNDPFKSKVLGKPAFKMEYGNRAREILDLLFNNDEGNRLIDEFAAVIDDPTRQFPSIVDADRAMWDYHPVMSSGKVNSSKAGKGRFYNKASTKDFPGMVKIMKNYIRTRSSFILKSAARDTKHPDQPTIKYSGSEGYPVNALKFRSSEFSDSSGKFAGMKWRLAEVSAPDAPPYDPSNPRQYEINADWESDILTVFADTISLPSGLAKVGHWYRARVRMLDDTQRWSHWSEPFEFQAGEPDTLESLKAHLLLTELMYNAPAGPGFDYLELHNNSNTTALDLSGMTLSDGVRFIAPAGLTLAPGQYALVIGHDDEAAFRAHYRLTKETNILGTYSGKLANNGETIQVHSAIDGTVLVTLNYDDEDKWPKAADGNNRSLVPLVLDPVQQALGALNNPSNWQPSSADGGSPGQEDLLPADNDQDGLPDDWELAHNLNPMTNDAALDFDGDGANNTHEFLAGTNPGDAASRLELGLSIDQAGELLVEFIMQPGRQYFLETATSIDGEWGSIPGDVYQPMPEAISKTIRVPRARPGNGNNRFFRLRVKRLAD